MKANSRMNLSFKYESNVCKIDEEDIVDYCYQIDENEVPFHYRLKTITKIIPNFVQKVRILIKNLNLNLKFIARILNMLKFGKKLNIN
jgi:hypothetical protein